MAVVCLVLFTGYQALKARTALQNASADFQELSSQLVQGDESAARASVASAQDAAETARANTRGPGWWVARRLPVIGDDATAVATVADVVHGLSHDVMPEVVTASTTLTPEALRPVHGRFRLAPIEDVAPSVVAADRALRRESGRVAAIDTAALVPQLRGPVGDLQDKLHDAAALTGKAAKAVRLLPDMLGAHGRRTYLLMVQNNAEVRATGGLPGALSLLTANHGRIRLTGQGGAGSLGSYDTPVLPLTRAERTLFGAQLGIYPQDSNFTPDFPRTGRLVRAEWKRATGQRLDGVVSVDPVALSYVLDGTGPIKVPTGQQLTASNAVKLLLNDVYQRIPDPEMQDAFFATVAQRVFHAVTTAQGDPARILHGLSRAASEHRLLIWSAHDDEQAVLEQTPLSGDLKTRASETPYVGVFLNDSAADKMSYYLDYRVDVTPTACRPDRSQKLTVTVHLRSRAPRDAASLAPSIVGPGARGVPLGHILTTVLLYAPVDGSIDRVRIGGEQVRIAEYDDLPRPVGSWTVGLAPGERQTLEYDVTTGPHQPGDVALRTTPGVHGAGVGDVRPSACS